MNWYHHQFFGFIILPSDQKDKNITQYLTGTGKERLGGGQREFLHRKRWMHHHDSLQLLEVKAREMGICGQGVIITLLPWLPLLVSARHTRTHAHTRSPRVGTVLIEQSQYAFWGVWCPPLCWGSFHRKGSGVMTCVRACVWLCVLHSDRWEEPVFRVATL